MGWLVFLALILWVYILSIFKRGKMGFGFFLIGSIGMFLLLIIVMEPLVSGRLTQAVAFVASTVGNRFGICESYVGNSMILLNTHTNALAMVVDLECSGLIEIFSFSSLLWFFPVYCKWEKAGLNIIGIVYIILANVVRILLINIMVYYWGNDIYYLAHSVLARVVFYLFNAILYFYVFTRAQIIRQKVGKVKYEIV